ncbi:MAG: outer membrane lipoprotein-sorting protein [Desulfobulbaceae bacterium]|nr:outer membrane lipoprotein-sorting protein [Desulfobulbaceae bacterium]
MSGSGKTCEGQGRGYGGHRRHQPGRLGPRLTVHGGGNVAYDRVSLWADRDTLLPTRIECLTEAEMLIKTILFKEIKDFGGSIVRPSVIETDSPLYQGYRSIMIFAGIKERILPDEVFTQTFMPNLESLRWPL